MTIYSFSRLTLYEQCPRAYWFGYLCDPPIPQETNQYMITGTVFHKFAEDFHKNVDRDRVMSEGTEYIDTFKNGDMYADGFIEYEKQRFDVLKKKGFLENYFPVMIENMMYGTVAGVEIRGVVDRVDRLMSGDCAIIDYKPNPPWREQDWKKLRIQMTIYAELVEQTTDLPVKYMGSWFYKKQEVWLNRIPVQTRKMAENFVSRIVRNIENEEEYLPNFSEACNRCSYRKICFDLRNYDLQRIRETTQTISTDNG